MAGRENLDALLDESLTPEEVKSVRDALAQSTRACGEQAQTWRRISKEVLRPWHDFKLHRSLLQATYRSWNEDVLGPPPIWIPTEEGIRDTNLARFMAAFQGSPAWDRHRTGDAARDLALLQKISCHEPEAFWPPLLRELRIQFEIPPSRVCESGRDPSEVAWLPQARLNIAASALDARDPDAPAVLWAEEGAPTALHSMSLGELRKRSRRVAAALRASGLQPGEAVAICMPMTVWAVAAYLGVVLAGCVVVGVADSFSAAEIAARLRISKAALLVTQDVLLRDGRKLPLYARAKQQASVPAVVLPGDPEQGLQVELKPGDRSWDEFLAACSGRELEVPAMEPETPTNILFSSGTTGDPKAIPWTHVTPIRAATDSWAQLDVRGGDVMAFPTNLGWMMGPFLVYGALLNGAVIALFHGSPLGRPFCQFVSAARVTMLGVVPSIVKAWRRNKCTEGLDWSSVRCFASTGEASSPEDSHWLSAQGGYKPMIELCGGTEIGGAFLSGSLLQPQAPSTFSTPTLGAQLVLLEEGSTIRQSSHESGEPTTGELAIVPPMLGASQRLLNADHHKIYYQGMPKHKGVTLRRHGDIFQRLPGGFYRAQGRSDDTMNLGGIKVSSVELERACVAAAAAVSEAAAVAVPQPGGGPDSLVMFIVPAAGAGADAAAMKGACQAAIRSAINPLFKLDRVVLCKALPRTATNKVMRRVLRKQAMAKSSL